MVEQEQWGAEGVPPLNRSHYIMYNFNAVQAPPHFCDPQDDNYPTCLWANSGILCHIFVVGGRAVVFTVTTQYLLGSLFVPSDEVYHFG
jgi:hypothetical protein